MTTPLALNEPILPFAAYYENLEGQLFYAYLQTNENGTFKQSINGDIAGKIYQIQDDFTPPDSTEKKLSTPMNMLDIIDFLEESHVEIVTDINRVQHIMHQIRYV